MAPPKSSVLSLRGVALAGYQRSDSAGMADFDLARHELAVVEMDEDRDAAAFLDLCLGLVAPPSGEVHCLGQGWHTQSYHDMLAHRRRIGTLVGSQVWPEHMPVTEVALAAQLYHTDHTEPEVIAQATVLARRFGMPGLPTAASDAVPPGDLVRAACVRAFLGAPEFVLIADAVLEATGELGTALAQAIGAVQDHGGAVLWLLSSRMAPAARFVTPDHVLRLDDRGLTRMRGPR